MNRNALPHSIGKQYLIPIMFIAVILGLTGMISFMSETAVVHAIAFTVNVTADATDTNPGDGLCEIDTPPSDLCTLRAAIQEANASAGIDEIIVPGGVFTMNRVGSDDTAFAGDLDITDDVIIRGNVVTPTIINGGGIDRVFHITGSVSVTISSVTVRNGNTVDNGGGFLNNGGVLTVISSTIRSNRASNNGGGIFNGGALKLVNSTVSTNTAVFNGGGIMHSGGAMTVTNSTLSGNSAADGGGFYINGGSSLLTNITLSNNTATLGAGIAQSSGTVALKNSIVYNAISGVDCSGTIISNGNNLNGDGTCNFTKISDLPAVNPQLAPLQDNGGPTLTHALLVGSPAIDAGDDAFCPGTDQRGAPRYVICDIGAYEIEIYHLYLPLILKDYPPIIIIPDRCNKKVPVYTIDTAPTDGTLILQVLFGELGRLEGITMKIWDVAAGQRINNDKAPVHAPKWVRVWWHPDGDPSWYLLPSQYWVGGGTVASEYGVSCGDAPAPTYHTSFGSAIPESEVPIFTLP